MKISQFTNSNPLPFGRDFIDMLKKHHSALFKILINVATKPRSLETRREDEAVATVHGSFFLFYRSMSEDFET